MFGCSDVYHWMGFGTYLQHGQSPPVSTSRTAAVDTRTYHGSKVTRSTHRLRLLLSPTMLVLITDFRFRFSGPPAISRGSRARHRKARMHQDSTGRVHSGIASQISFAVGNALRNPDQELIEPDARFWTHTEIGVVVKSQIRHATLFGVNQLLRINGASGRKRPCIGLSLWFYRRSAPDGFLAVRRG